jgi:hypothetical protein
MTWNQALYFLLAHTHWTFGTILKDATEYKQLKLSSTDTTQEM